MGVSMVLRGADFKVFINGQLFAVATELHWSMENGRHAIMGIDQMTPFELAPGASTIKGSISCVRLREDGGIEGYGIAAPQSMIMLEKYFNLTVVDRSTDTVILDIEKAAVGSQSWEVRARGEFTGSFSFEGMAWVQGTNSGF